MGTGSKDDRKWQELETDYECEIQKTQNDLQVNDLEVGKQCHNATTAKNKEEIRGHMIPSILDLPKLKIFWDVQMKISSLWVKKLV